MTRGGYYDCNDTLERVLIKLTQLRVGKGFLAPLRHRYGLPGSTGNGQPMPIKLGATALLAATLAGCATSLNVDPFVAPAKFQFLRCEDIAKRLVAAQNREQELRALMDRAETGVGGPAVNILVYQPDFQTTQSELRQLREAAIEKHCPDEARKVAPKVDTGKPR